MKVKISAGCAVGSITAPPGKSFLHRLLFCAALSDGESRIMNISLSDDILATLDCIRALGADVKVKGDCFIITGGGNGTGNFFCRQSGTTLRLCVPCAMKKRENAVFYGDNRLIERGISEYSRMFDITSGENSVSVSGGLSPGEYVIDGSRSSQFASGLLIALGSLYGDSTLKILPPVVSRPYIDMTLDVMRRFGAQITEKSENCFEIRGGCYKALDIAAEGDWSNSAPMLALKFLGGDVKIDGLDTMSRQGDRVFPELLHKLENGSPDIDITDIPDLAPMLFALAAVKNGSHFTGTCRLKEKESDRVSSMADELRKFGVRLDISDDSVTVHPTTLCKPTEALSGHNDHRIIMALSVLCTLTGGEIEGAEAINKSYPTFFDDLRSLGIIIEQGE